MCWAAAAVTKVQSAISKIQSCNPIRQTGIHRHNPRKHSTEVEEEDDGEKQGLGKGSKRCGAACLAFSGDVAADF